MKQVSRQTPRLKLIQICCAADLRANHQTIWHTSGQRQLYLRRDHETAFVDMTPLPPTQNRIPTILILELRVVLDAPKYRWEKKSGKKCKNTTKTNTSQNA